MTRLHKLRGTTDYELRPPVAKSAPHRVCAEPGCHTRLSVYNHGRYCGLHEPYEFVGRAKVCNRCGQAKPADDEHWTRDRYRADGFNPICKTCRNEAYRLRYSVKHAKRRLTANGKDSICRQCGRVLARSGEFWAFGNRGRLIQPCLDCQDANRKRRGEQRMEAYYRRKYGMGRAEYLAEHGDTRLVCIETPRGTAYAEVTR